MSLIDLKQHMMAVKIATLSSLCSLFKVDASLLRCMMSHWIRKGKIRQCTRPAGCGSKCFKCPTAANEMYEWVAS